MTESTPFGPEQFRQLNRDLMEQVLDRAAIDPEWKQRLLDDPEAAIVEADFPEARQLQEMQGSVEAEEAEVTGHQYGCTTPGCTRFTWVPGQNAYSD
jgi:hypothetical protein